MQATLRKLAEQLRAEARHHDTSKLIKCAQVAQAALALELLRRKIG